MKFEKVIHSLKRKNKTFCNKYSLCRIHQLKNRGLIQFPQCKKKKGLPECKETTTNLLDLIVTVTFFYVLFLLFTQQVFAQSLICMYIGGKGFYNTITSPAKNRRAPLCHSFDTLSSYKRHTQARSTSPLTSFTPSIGHLNLPAVCTPWQL